VRAVEKLTSKVYAIKILDKRHIVREKKVKYVCTAKSNVSAYSSFRVRYTSRKRCWIGFPRTLSWFGFTRHFKTRRVCVIWWWLFDFAANYLVFVLDLAENGELLSWIRKVRFLDSMLECLANWFVVGNIFFGVRSVLHGGTFMRGRVPSRKSNHSQVLFYFIPILIYTSLFLHECKYHYKIVYKKYDSVIFLIII
jgi:hypothetical protein